MQECAMEVSDLLATASPDKKIKKIVLFIRNNLFLLFLLHTFGPTLTDTGYPPLSFDVTRCIL